MPRKDSSTNTDSDRVLVAKRAIFRANEKERVRFAILEVWSSRE